MPTHRGDPIPTAIDLYRLELRHQEGRRPTHTGQTPVITHTREEDES